MARELNFSVTASQAAFLALDCRFPGYVGGLGAGKSHCMAISGIIGASQSSNAVIAMYEPTHDHIKRIILPKVEEILSDNGISYTHNKQDHIIYTSSTQFGDFIFRSMENPALIVGYEAYQSHTDELDVLPQDKASDAWIRIIARSRQRPKGLINPFNRVSAYSTPEGYKFMYKMWGDPNKNPDYQMVNAKTKDNPYLPDGYLQSLKDTYPDNLIDAYLNGEFVNLHSFTVYDSYDKRIHESSEQIQPGETLFIGCDFNVGHTSGTVYVKRKTVEWHAVAELVDKKDTPAMIEEIVHRWYSRGHKIIMYPDASGKARHSSNASESDIGLLHKAGFGVRAHKKNPDVRDRIKATNKAFNSGKLFINSVECPNTAKCLEQQSYDKAGEPDKKSGYDHQNDATTYPIAYEMPIRRPMFAIDFSYVT